jgi:hypothetical protein
MAGRGRQICTDCLTAETPNVLDAPSGAQLIGNVASSTNLLSTLGVHPTLGRSFLPEETKDGRSHVILLSYGLWHEAFSADRHILGKTVHIDGVPYVVIGVMPPHFQFPMDEYRAEVWTPLERSRLVAASANNGYNSYHPIIRIEPGFRALAVEAELSSVQARIAQMARPGEEIATRIQLRSLRDSLVGDIRPALKALEIAVAAVWFIACCNVAGLMLARIAVSGCLRA